MRISDWSSDVCSSDLSSTLSTKAFCGGFKYRPITSAALAANSGSVLTHHDRWRCNWMPSLRSARHTASSDTLSAIANEPRSEEHTSELQSLMRISYAVFCLKKKKQLTHNIQSCTQNQESKHVQQPS